jgi:hypothetical protein
LVLKIARNGSSPLTKEEVMALFNAILNNPLLDLPLDKEEKKIGNLSLRKK